MRISTRSIDKSRHQFETFRGPQSTIKFARHLVAVKHRPKFGHLRIRKTNPQILRAIALGGTANERSSRRPDLTHVTHIIVGRRDYNTRAIFVQTALLLRAHVTSAVITTRTRRITVLI